METRPDLDRLGDTEKDDLIRALRSQVEDLSGQISALLAKIAELEGRLAQTSRNSSKPPSSDGLNKPKPKSLRQPGQKPTGGQAGHPGQTLKRVAQADRIETHAPPRHCDTCGLRLPEATVAETRQVFEVPPLRHEVIEHQVLEATCACGQVHRGTFPVEVSAPVQYGPRLKATVVHLTHHQMLPVARTGALMGDLFGLPLSDGTVLAFQAEAGKRLAPTVNAIGEALKTVSVAHADETGMRVAGTLFWLHLVATTSLTWIGAHAKRGRAAFDAFGILTAFVGTLVHDGWKPYRELACQHALCNAHHLRELTFIHEQMGQAWAKRLIDLLVAASQEVAAATGPLSADRRTHFRTAYLAILETGDALNPRAPPSGKRGRTKQSKARNLLDRLRDQAMEVWRFMDDPTVPFTNNLAERDVRMPKVKQKISGGFRTQTGLETFCTIRSYLATLQKQGVNLFDALVLTFQGVPPQPRLA